MIFFDSSALLPLFLNEEHSAQIQEIVQDDPFLVVWWGSTIECFSAFARLRRERIIAVKEEQEIRGQLLDVRRLWTEIQPGNDLKALAHQLLLVHALAAADSMQLAAALMWADKLPSGHQFVSLHARLKDAARKEGFLVQPAARTNRS
jgi:predicted nucleic acid-binding protein